MAAAGSRILSVVECVVPRNVVPRNAQQNAAVPSRPLRCFCAKRAGCDARKPIIRVLISAAGQLCVCTGNESSLLLWCGSS